ncbi:TonB-dependent receptor [Paucibacter sp. APW11]|uniref:TonB-dependent receptor n=1 Tax=Roseateles aquae TaxID=3077235 RepID=A0ABU3PAD9_9BURK|nr:TonB-dependent receptor [Paucibacter sp. APW11]MDT8998711.1 TonB-dependent receptor [Paucibacter sp. APW11]
MKNSTPLMRNARVCPAQNYNAAGCSLHALNTRSRFSVVALAFGLLATGTQAQQIADKLDQVVVTGNPLGERDPVQSSQVLSGQALTLSRGATLGDSLDQISGVGSSYFGPNSNRPTIRGLDGDRVRILSNAGASVDASSLSFDHGVPVDPLVIERIEVLRGPSALLYGGSAMGGVVNTLDNRIPRVAGDGLSGVTELRLGGASRERNAAMVLEGGDKRWAWHVDASGRSAGDLAVPEFSAAEGSVSHRVRNSASDSHGAALGSSLFFGKGFAGVSIEDYHSHYGVTVEPDVTIKMQRQRIATAGAWNDAGAMLSKVQWQLNSSRYEHVELEGDGSVGTRFKSSGKDLRVEAEHRAIGDVRGVIGAQMESSTFSAVGEEALVPSTATRSSALFLLEQWQQGAFGLSGGVRVEQARVRSDGDGADGVGRFGPALERRFSPRSFSFSASYHTTPELGLTMSVNHSERAPSFYELFANGVHVASGAYERGDATLDMEHATGLDLGMHWASGGGSAKLNIYRTRFANYLALNASGQTVTPDGDSTAWPEYRYQGVRAQLTGYELELRQAWTLAGWQLAGSLQLDGVRGEDLSHAQPLPRIAPQRLGLGLEAQQGAWTLRADWHGVARQSRVPAEDRATAGYGLLKLSVARQFRWGDTDALWYLKLDNLGNQLAYSASTVATMRDLAPLPGRSLHTGLQLRF